MKKSAKMSLMTGGLLLVAFLLNLGVASACTYNCVKVTGGGPFCRRCLDTGVYTGITCQDSGQCGCFFTQNTCGLSASGIQAQTGLAAIVQTDAVNVCPATTTDTVLPAALLQ